MKHGAKNMNKKILVFGALAALMLVTISFASAVTTQTQNKRKDSPLFNIRSTKVKNIVTTFLHRDRIFLLPNLLQRLLSPGDSSKPHEVTMWKGNSGNLCCQYETSRQCDL